MFGRLRKRIKDLETKISCLEMSREQQRREIGDLLNKLRMLEQHLQVKVVYPQPEYRKG